MCRFQYWRTSAIVGASTGGTVANYIAPSVTRPSAYAVTAALIVSNADPSVEAVATIRDSRATTGDVMSSAHPVE
jgi:hypothetical protein